MYSAEGSCTGTACQLSGGLGCVWLCLDLLLHFSLGLMHIPLPLAFVSLNVLLSSEGAVAGATLKVAFVSLNVLLSSEGAVAGATLKVVTDHIMH